MGDKWKVLAIVFITLFILENIFFFYSYNLVQKEEKLTTQCYYEICEDNVYAEYDLSTNLCTCYDLDITGTQYIVDEYHILK